MFLRHIQGLILARVAKDPVKFFFAFRGFFRKNGYIWGETENYIVMAGPQITPETKVYHKIDRTKRLRPWQKEFWEALMDKCPTAMPEDGMEKLTPEALWALACLYFQGEDEDTMIKKDFIRSGESAGKVVEITTTRPFSWYSFELFCLYHGIRNSLSPIRENRDDRYPQFKEVVARINQVIYEQKFDGAAIGGYNPQLIIRDLGLVDKVDANVKTEQPLFVDTPQAPAEDAQIPAKPVNDPVFEDDSLL